MNNINVHAKKDFLKMVDQCVNNVQFNAKTVICNKITVPNAKCQIFWFHFARVRDSSIK